MEGTLQENTLIEVTLKNGIQIEVDKNAFNDMRVVELMASDDPLAYAKVVQLVLTKEAKNKMYSSIQLDNGRIPSDKFGELFEDLMRKIAEKNQEVKN